MINYLKEAVGIERAFIQLRRIHLRLKAKRDELRDVFVSQDVLTIEQLGGEISGLEIAIKLVEEEMKELFDFNALEDEGEEDEGDTVKKPNHYVGLDGLEVEEVLKNFIPTYRDAYVAHRVASAIEYLLRAPRKNGDEDVLKARENLDQIAEYFEGR